jgi:acetyl-CoA synthetase
MAASYVWTPTPEQAERTNVGQFMKRHGISDYADLIRRSTKEIEWFWQAIVNDLPIDFYEPFHTLVDSSKGIAWSRWFVGGKLNLVHNCLDRHARSSRRERPAIVWEGEAGATRTLSYAELDLETCRMANALKRLGVNKGDRVGLFLPMLPETVVAFLAIAKLGAIVVPIFSGFGTQAVVDRLNDCDTRVLITADGFRRRGAIVDTERIAREAAAQCPSLEHRIIVKYLDRGGLPQPGFDLWWHEIVAREEGECPTEPLDPEVPFLIAYTSGTTGKPKGSVHVHGGFLAKIAQEVCHQVDLRPDDLLYWFSDMGWIMGPWEVVGTLALGGAVFLYDGAPDYPAPDRIWSQVERHKITIIGLSPTLVRALMRSGEGPVRAHDLSSLRILASTGEPWNPDPWLWYFENVGGSRCPVINLSGGTEVGASLLAALPISPLKPCTLVGPALGMNVDVFDAEGNSVVGEVGELVCKSPWPGMTRGIWKDPERYQATYWSRWPDVWVHGDWASIDADGHWFLHGRSDDTIKIAGKRIGPAEIESVLVGHPAVSESAAIGVPDELKGEVVWCFAILRPGFEPTETLRSELRERVATALGKSFAPEQVKFVADLPRTRSAKILRRAIRARVINQDPGDLSSLENPRALDEIKKAR